MAVLLADLVATSDEVAATSRRSAKVATLADLLRRLEASEVEAAVGFLVGRPRQGRVGIGWASVRNVDVAPAAEPSLTVADVDRAVTTIEGITGPGSVAERQSVLTGLFAQATEPEGQLLGRLLLGELRHGALEGVMADAIAKAAGVPLDLVRRAAMLSGDLGATARIALTDGATGLEGVGLHVLRGVQPMLAASSTDVASALAETGPASVEWKLDGARIQVHRDGDQVAIFTRNLNDITERLPSVAAAVRALPVGRIVLDGESIGLDDNGRPHRFQDTISSFSRDQPGAGIAGPGLQAFFFDVLHVDGDDLLDRPLEERLGVLDDVAAHLRLPAVRTDDALRADAFAAGALAAGHEGVMVKALDAPYQAGRRGGSWRKVKPVRTLDLVVLAAEWGHGRRTGWLSNLHLGARGPDGTFVMVGKTFKGMTDALLRWQTERLQQLSIGTEGHVVHVRPELVVEVALDGVQVSPRYPGGVALRFARIRRYREDKQAADADRIEDVRALLD
jgi:DNA ligase 1